MQSKSALTLLGMIDIREKWIRDLQQEKKDIRAKYIKLNAKWKNRAISAEMKLKRMVAKCQK